MRRPPPPKNTRNGLKWRAGRPRWEPSPASRKLGLKGLDLKDIEGRWIGEPTIANVHAGDRQTWAGMIREAAQGGAEGEEAASVLRGVLEALPHPVEPFQRQRRQMVQDLIEAAQARLAGEDATAGVSLARGPRTAERLVEAYFAAVDDGKVPIKSGTRRAYHAQRAPFVARFAGRGIASIKRQELIAWYGDLLEEVTVACANLRLGATSAFLAYAFDLDWVAASPAVKLGIKKAQGRRVFWTLEEERTFTAWCDANGFADVSDAVVAGLWTGARIIDLCAANLQDLGGDVWHFVPIKTEGAGQEAMPGIMPQVRARIERRRAAAIDDQVRLLNATPFLWNTELHRRHDTRSIWKRFRKAKAAAIEAGAVPETLALKKQQDTRDTCITRLFEADVAPARMWTWTGHSQAGIEEILKEHYIVLRAAGQLELMRKLEAWAEKEALSL